MSGGQTPPWRGTVRGQCGDTPRAASGPRSQGQPRGHDELLSLARSSLGHGWGCAPARLWTRIFVNSYGFNGDSYHRVVSGFVFMNKDSGYLFFLWRSWGKQMWLGLIFIQDIKSVKHLFWGSAWEHPLPAVTFPPVCCLPCTIQSRCTGTRLWESDVHVVIVVPAYLH